MHVNDCPSPRMAKCTSLGILEQDINTDTVDQDDIIGLTQDVKNFSDGLAKLKTIFNEHCESEDMRVLAHERLGNVLCTLKSVLQRYPPLNTTELISAAGILISKIKNYNYEEHESTASMESAFSDSIDQLALEFSNSVSDYLMGDLQHNFVEEKTKSYDNLLCASQEMVDKDDTEEEVNEAVVQLAAEQIDSLLMSCQTGLELAFQRGKAWSKYLKDVVSYIERRAQLGVEYSKSLSRLAGSVKPALTQEAFLPLQSVYCTVLSQDVEYAKTCQATFTLLQTTKFVEPINARRNEHDKVRKSLKETWNKEVKKMQEALNNLRKSQAMYITRQQEYEKAKELSQKSESDLGHSLSSTSNLTAKVDKKKKAEDDALHKAAEAETTYKACMAEANNRQTDILRVKNELLAAIREQIFLSDQIIKEVTIDYFQLLQTVSAPIPVQYHTLCETSKKYEPGSQYSEYVRRLPLMDTPMVQFEEFKFEPYNAEDETDNKTSRTQSNGSSSSDQQPSAEGSPPVVTQRRTDKYRVPVRAWVPQGVATNSDSDSNKSQDTSPNSSPYLLGQKKHASGSTGCLIESEDMPASIKQLLAVPGSDLMDGHPVLQRKGRRNTTFGVDFQEQVEHYHTAVPPIISKCLQEVEKRGITLKGIYRVSGVKSTVENLCQKFESDPESVDLVSENPNVIANVLKLYLRQLPEPLLTFKLYQHFVQVAKESLTGGLDEHGTIDRLHDLIDDLPYSNRKTCAVLMHHLKRVTVFAKQNHMNASNLGIVFGPTLLRPLIDNASMTSLADSSHQTRVVELLIVHAEILFGPMEDHQLILGDTYVEPIEMKSMLLIPQQATIELPKESAVRQEPKKETMPSPTISLLPRVREIVPPNVQQPAAVLEASKEPVYNKKMPEDILLPGSTNFDRKDLYQPRASSDGKV